jgi:hypothetical protein
MQASSSPELPLGYRHQVSKGYLEDERRRSFKGILKTEADLTHGSLNAPAAVRK